MVCPNCGNDEFTATLSTRTEYTYTFEGGQWVEHDAQVTDGGDLGDVDTFTCTDCGAEVTEDDLITEGDYIERETNEHVFGVSAH